MLLFGIYHISFAKKIDECHKLLQTMATLPRSNDVIQDTIIEDVIVKKVSNNVSSPVVITDEHPDDMYEELSHYFVTDEISKPISRTTLLTSAKNLLGL